MIKMVLKPDQERLKALLKETITLLCKNGLNYSSEFCIEALIGITLDKDDVMLVSINETVQTEAEKLLSSELDGRNRKSASSTPHRDNSNPPTPKTEDRMDSPSHKSSFSRQRKRSHNDNDNDSWSNDDLSPAKRPFSGSTNNRSNFSDVVVIKEESDSDDDACVISKTTGTAPPTIPSDLANINFDQAQLVPMGGSIPGCSSWSAVPTGVGDMSTVQNTYPMMPPPPHEPPRTQVRNITQYNVLHLVVLIVLLPYISSDVSIHSCILPWKNFKV